MPPSPPGGAVGRYACPGPELASAAPASPPHRGLSLDAGPEALELLEPAERGVPDQGPVQLPPAGLLCQPCGSGLPGRTGHAELRHEALEPLPVLTDLALEPLQLFLEGGSPVLRQGSLGQLVPSDRTGQVVVQVDRQEALVRQGA